MGEKTSFIKTLVLPAVFSLLLFLLLTYILLPFYRRHRARLPIPSEALIAWRPSTLTQRISARFAAFANRREDRHLNQRAHDIDHQDELLDDGEELGVVDDDMRRVIESHESTASGRRPENHRRLSRDLEEGFRDDSDDEPER